MRIRRTAWRENPRPLPEGSLVAAIGDVHGCAGHLDAMYRALARDVVRLSPRETCCVLLGDLIDRGPHSLRCLELAADGLASRVPDRPVRDVVLTGNHDEWLVQAVRGELSRREAEVWALNGGTETWRDFGIVRPTSVQQLVDGIRGRLPQCVLDLLARMVVMWRKEDLVFAHAGVDPRYGLEEQTRASLMWIRTPFLEAQRWPFPFMVVHGHTIEQPYGEPVIHPHRIGIDTGAVVTGVLTCVEFWGSRLRFVTVDQR